ncbi:MAG: Uma2 family endonuclease [Catalinimonas sp.]
MTVTLAPTRLFTVQEFMHLAEVGVFDPDERPERLRGHIVPMSPIGTRHAAVRRLLLLRIRRTDGYYVDAQNPISLEERSLPQPDLALPIDEILPQKQRLDLLPARSRIAPRHATSMKNTRSEAPKDASATGGVQPGKKSGTQKIKQPGNPSPVPPGLQVEQFGVAAVGDE